MRKVRSYTLVEMILVLFVVGILLGLGISSLSNRIGDSYYGEVCVNGIYGGLSNYMYMASMSKILTGSTSPDFYRITQNTSGSGSFELSYGTIDPTNGAETSQLYRTYRLNDEALRCRKGTRYAVKFGPEKLELRFTPGLLPKGQQDGFSIYRDAVKQVATGDIEFRFCFPADLARGECQDFAHITFDKRTGLITKRFCKQYTGSDGKKCHQWSTGE